MNLTFQTIDVETANPRRASICQIGIVEVRSGKIVDEWESLVNPEECFATINKHKHSIDELRVANSPKFPDIYSEMQRRLDESILVSHSPFDRVACERVLEKYKLEQFRVTWLDSAVVVRRAWPERYGKQGYGLANVASDLNIQFNHHDALEDARAAALVLLRDCQETSNDVDYWVDATSKKNTVRRKNRDRSAYFDIHRSGDNEGPLAGFRFVFTGTLAIPRNQAKELVRQLGASVSDSVTNSTTHLVVGIQDPSRLAGFEKSSKNRDAIKRIGEGQDIEVLSEEDFQYFVNE